MPFPSVCSVRRASCTGGTRKETTLSWRRREGGGGVGRGFPSPGECVSDAIKQISVGGTLVDVRRRDGPAIDADRIGGSVTQSPSQPRHQQTPSCSSPSVVRTPSDRSVAEFCRVTDSVVGSPKRSFCVCVCVCVCWTALSKVRAIELNPRRARAGSDSRRVVLISFCFSSSSSSEQVYRGRNITNIVEAGRTVKIDNWCKTGHGRKCKTVQSVKPYRCLGESRRLHHLPVQGPRAALRHSGRRRCGGRPKSDNLSFSIRLRWHLEIVQPVFFFSQIFSSPLLFPIAPSPSRQGFRSFMFLS